MSRYVTASRHVAREINSEMLTLSMSISNPPAGGLPLPAYHGLLMGQHAISWCV